MNTLDKWGVLCVHTLSEKEKDKGSEKEGKAPNILEGLSCKTAGCTAITKQLYFILEKSQKQ